MMDIDAFSEAVAEIYDAAVSVDRWDAVLATLARLFQGSKAQITYANSIYDSQPLYRLFGFDPVVLSKVMVRYEALTIGDPRRTALRFKPVHCRQLLSESDLRDSDIYKEALAPAGIEYTMFVIIDCEDDAVCVVGVMRGPEASPFTEAECEDFGRFTPHIARAVSMRDSLRRAREITVASRALIDGVPLAMIVLEEGRILLTNAAASALLDQGDALRRGADGALQTATPLAGSRLAGAIAEAREAQGAAVGLSMEAGDGGRLRGVARALERESAEVLGAGAGAVALYLTDSRRPIETDADILSRMFGLTARAAAVVRALADGDDPRAIAARLGIGLETVRTHLKQAMQIVGVNRQAELVKAVVSSPAWIAAPRRSGAVQPPGLGMGNRAPSR